MKQLFEMSNDELEKMKTISQSQMPVMKFGDHWSGMDTQERANHFWKELAEKYGFIWDSVESAGTGIITQFKATSSVTAQSLANKLNNCVEEPPSELIAKAKEHGFVIVYGASDDLMEADGAISDEYGVGDGSVVLFDKQGALSDYDALDHDDEDLMQQYFARKPHVKPIKAHWDSGEYSWTYSTDIPHAKFDIIEDGEKYCQGIVFSINNLS